MSVELRTLIREVALDLPEADPREIAQSVAKRTPKANLAAFYAEALVELVTDILRHDRRGAMDHALKERDQPSPKPSNRSPKRDERRDWWAEMLSSRVHIGDSEWKTLDLCTVDDLQFCVDERQNNIDRLNGQILNYKQLIQLMVKHGARTVADLPPQKDWKAAA